MGLSVPVLAACLALSYSHSYSDYYGARDTRDTRDTRTDRYGSYYFDSRGYKRYSRCLDRAALPREDCRDSLDRGRRYDTVYDRNSYGRDSYYRDSHNRYDRDYRYRDYDRGVRGKVNVGRGRFDLDRNDRGQGVGERDSTKLGQGTYRVTNGGRDAELTCEFPRGSHIISNIIWERVKDRDYDRYSSLRSWLGARMRVDRHGDYGSSLIIRDYEPRDEGVYRCVGTRTYDNYGSSYRHSTYDRTETVYMEVQFIPRDGGREGYSGYFAGRDNEYPRSGYRSSYWRTAGVSSSQDTIVPDGQVEQSEDTSSTE